MEKIKYKGYTIEIKQNEFIDESPRYWDNCGKIIYHNNNYQLGDEKFKNDNADNWKENFAYYIVENYLNDLYDPCGLTDSEINKVWKWIDKNVYYLPLFVYIHSGVSLSTTRFSCGWDSGNSGYIYALKKNWQGGDDPLKQLEDEIKTFDDYMQGNVWDYEITDSNGEYIDSCCGYIGDWDSKHLLDDAKVNIDSIVCYIQKEKYKKLKNYIKSGVNLQYRQLSIN